MRSLVAEGPGTPLASAPGRDREDQVLTEGSIPAGRRATMVQTIARPARDQSDQADDPRWRATTVPLGLTLKGPHRALTVSRPVGPPGIMSQRPCPRTRRAGFAS